jgi:hypothetical protein
MLAALLAAVLVLATVNSSPAPAAELFGQARQESPQAREAREAMKKLAWLTGRWSGTAAVTQAPGATLTLQQSEDVRLKVFDTSLLIEGTGRETGAEGQPGEVVFQALAVITWDAQAKGYAMRAITERGSVDPTIEVKEKEIIWGFSTSAGRVRYHIKLDEQGRWHETGEFSRDDGSTWVKFIEMTLERVEEQP